MSPTPEQFEPEKINARVYYEVGGQPECDFYDDIDTISNEGNTLKIIYGKDNDGDRQRYMNYDMDRVICWKEIHLDGDLATE